MYSYNKLLRLVEKLEAAKSEEEIKAIAKKELAIWEIITNEIRKIASKLKNSGVLTNDEYMNLQDAYNNCELIRLRLEWIVTPNPNLSKSTKDLVQDIRNSLEAGYKKKLDSLIRGLKSKLNHVREEFKLLNVEIGDLEELD